MEDVIIELEDVSLCYRLARKRIGSFKDYLIHLVKGALIYEELWALRGIDLKVARGEIVGVVGPNGAGKSTLSKVICGVFKPTRGRCIIHGGGMISPILELGTGFDHELTGYENIFFNALLLGRKRQEVNEKVEEIVEFSGLGDFINTPVRNYSTGMVARLGFAIATAWVPDILILDEVLAVGDARFVDRCLERMHDLRSSGATVVLVTHNLGEVRDHCTRCVWIQQGEVRSDGEPSVVLPSYLEHIQSTGGSLRQPRQEPAA